MKKENKQFMPALFVVRVGLVVFILSLGAISPATSQLKTPPDWSWVLDSPAHLVTGQDVPDTAWRFVAMPPGWHMTTGPGALVFDPAVMARGRFSLEAEIFLFPGDSQNEYGIFIGGSGFDQDRPSYSAFVVRRDGSAAVFENKFGKKEFLMQWSRKDGVLAHPGKGTVKNILRVDAELDSIIFSVNNSEVNRMPRESISTSGQFGFRIGGDVNVHASRLDMTRRLAPVPVNSNQ